MDYNLSSEDLMLRDMFRDFAENEVKPLAAEVDDTEQFPMETVKKMSEIGMMGVPFPKEEGGQGGTNLHYAMLVEEIAKKCTTTSVIIAAHTSLCCWPIFQFGTDEQKKKYLPDLLSGTKIGAFGLTEPNAGTDASAQQTTAVLDGDNYILNGSKIFITNGGKASTYVIFAMTDKSQGTRGISAFIVESSYEGFSIGTVEKKLGIRGSSTSELIFKDCKVPKENILGREGKGFSIAMQTLDGGRIGVAAQALGLAEGAYEETVKYVKERKQFGKTLAKFQNTQFQIARMKTRIEAARHLVYNAANKKDCGLPYTQEAAMAKLYAAETAMDVTTKAIQLHGGYGFIRDYPVERMFRDAKITEIYEGTSEVQMMVIGGAELK